MTTDAKLILESICIGYALCSTAARKAMVDALPKHGWERVTGELFKNMDMHAIFNETIRKSMQIEEQPKGETSSPMAFIVDILKKKNAITRTLATLECIRIYLDGAGVQDLETLSEIHTSIIRSQGNGQPSKGTGKPANAVPASQAVADSQRTSQIP